jgi:hypothetical protein
VGHSAPFGDLLFERGAFLAQDKLLRSEDAFDGRSNLAANCRVLRGEIELGHWLRLKGDLWLCGHG